MATCARSPRTLTSEVLDRQPPDLQEFLLRTSILDQLSADLCRAVTDAGMPTSSLELLTRENLFVTPLDDRDEWFRYHHLFGELLRAQLERRAPANVATPRTGARRPGTRRTTTWNAP